VSLFVAACVEVPGIPPSRTPAEDGGAVGTDGGLSFDGGGVPSDTEPPQIRITSPADGTRLPATATSVLVEGTAADDVGVAAVQVFQGPNAWVAAQSDDFFHTWRVTLPLPPGTFPLRARAVDVAGKTAEVQISLGRTVDRGDQENPTLTITSPTDGAQTTRQSVVVTGGAIDDTGIARVEARVDGLTEFALAETTDTFAHFRAAVGLAPGSPNIIRVRATDLAGKTAERTVRVTSLLAADREPPKLTVTSPRPGATISTETVPVSGTASDNFGVAKVEVRVGSGAYVVATTSDGYATWSATVTLVTGANSLRVRATDVSELETVVTLAVVSTFVPAWDPPRDYELRLAAPRNRGVSLILNRQGLGEVIPESVRRSIVLMNLDPTPLMTNTMDAIKAACGAGWASRDFVPGCPAGWTAAEVNLWRLLTMTPDNVSVVGTSIEGVKDIAETLAGLGLIDDFSTILADALGINRYAEIVDTGNAVLAVRDDVIKTHPSANADGTLPVTIQDGFSDMAELSARFGPQGNHPGFLDPSVPTYSQVLSPSFQMTVQGTSNLTWYDGVDLSVGKEYIALLPTPTTDVVSFDFANTLTVTGLAADPTVDLVFVMKEHPTFRPAYTLENNVEPPPHPGLGAAWSISPWFIEHVLVDAAFRKYRARSPYYKAYKTLFDLITEAVVTVGANDPEEHLPLLNNPRPGWARFYTLFGLGDPPLGQYIWEMISEISQIRLRDAGVPEGQGSTRFVLRGIPVGLTPAQIIAQMRPGLESQKSVLAERLLGDYRRNNGAVDFYLWGTPGNLYLFFVHSTDPLPASYAYTKPGFFSDAALTQKVSTTAALTSGDAVHEKIRLGSSALTVYAQDASGAVYRLEVQPAQSDRVVLRASRKH
jgi:hypothetical protein